MQLTELNAISPIDGRYRSKTSSLAPYFSEEALIKYRVLVEIEYFIALREADLPQLAKIDKSVYGSLRAIYENFSTEDALWIKETEKTTNHDVKAVEYFIKSKFDGLGLQEFKEFIHFGLTSQDINNTAIPLSTKEAFENVGCRSPGGRCAAGRCRHRRRCCNGGRRRGLPHPVRAQRGNRGHSLPGLPADRL